MTLDNTNIAHIAHIAHITPIAPLHPLSPFCLSRLVGLHFQTQLRDLPSQTSEPWLGIILATLNLTSSEIQAKRLKEGAIN